MRTRLLSVIEFSLTRRSVVAIFADEVHDMEIEPSPHRFRVTVDNAARVEAFFQRVNPLGELEWVSYALVGHRGLDYPYFGSLHIDGDLVIAIAMNHLLPPVSSVSDVRLGAPKSVIRCEREFQCRRTDSGVILYDLGTL